MVVDGGSYFGRSVEELNDAMVAAACELYEKREALFGVETMRRIERGLLLQVIDTKWKDHLINVDALRSGIGLRSYGQIDPKNEFKKEGFRLFEEMLASIGDEVLMVLFRLKPEAPPSAGNAPSPAPLPPPAPATGGGAAIRPAPAAPVERPRVEPRPLLDRPAVVPKRPLEMPKPAAPAAAAAAAKQPVDLTRKAMDQASGGAPSLRSVNAPIGRAPPPGAVPRVGRNDDCPCGSGKKYKKCHGASAA